MKGIVQIKILVFTLIFAGGFLPGLHKVYAAGLVNAYDMTGYELKADKAALKASSDILFKCDEAALNDNEIYVCRIKNAKGEEGILTPVEDGEYILSEGESDYIKFYILDEIHGNITEVPDGEFSVSFMEDNEKYIEASFTYDIKTEKTGVIYLKGAAPYLELDTKDGLNTYVSVTDPKGNKSYHIEEDGTKLTFSEGNYGITVYARDGWGKVYYAALPFKQFIYDNTAPSSPEVKITSQAGARKLDDGTYVFSGNIELSPKSDDAISGVEKYMYRFSDGTIMEGNRLVLEPLFENGIEIFAVDMAGNVSAAGVIGQDIVLDDTSPVMSSYSLDATADHVNIRLEYGDDFSGMKKISVYSEGKDIYSREFSGRNVNKLLSEFKLSLSELERGRNEFKVRLSDNAGNESEYSFCVEKDAHEAPVITLKGSDEGQVHTEVPVKINIAVEYDKDTLADYRIVEIRKNKNGEVVSQRDLNAGLSEFTEEGYYTIEAVAADSEGNTARLIRHFTIDTNAPVIAPLDEFNKKILSSFAFNGDPGNVISDYSLFEYDVLLNGQEYDGSSIDEPGKYVLKLVATDELGRTSSERAEFIISSNEIKEHKIAEENIISENTAKLRRAAPILSVKRGTVKNINTTEIKDKDAKVKLTDESPDANSDEKEQEAVNEIKESKIIFLRKFIDFITAWLR